MGSTADTGSFASTPVTNITDFSGDLCWTEVQGSRVLLVRVLNWYLTNLTICAQQDSTAATAVENVVSFAASPQTLVEPRMVARVLIAALSRRMARNRAVRLDAADKGAF
ncbi:MAG TPA: hypothetical protein VGM27_00160 [Acidobacteriaceae bacterium]|jgi:hypothetical protein